MNGKEPVEVPSGDGRVRLLYEIPSDANVSQRIELSEEARQCVYGMSLRIRAVEQECELRRAALADAE